MANAIGQQNTPRLNHEAGRILFLGGYFSAELSLILDLLGIVQTPANLNRTNRAYSIARQCGVSNLAYSR